ncbi:MAG: universal stress protein, partial [Bacteroidetes bacterium]
MKQLYHLLCPVDFSAASYEAIEKAGFLAQLFQADLTLLHVVKVPVSFGVDYGMDEQSEVLTQKAARHARLLLREAKRAYIPYAVKCKSSIRFGQPAREILREVKQLKADLLIWGMESGGEGDELFAHLCEDLHIP